ncbi:tyrosine-protein phosphatase [Micrococcaceae bacterium Sec5.8]
MTHPADSGGPAQRTGAPGTFGHPGLDDQDAAVRWNGAVNAWHVAGSVFRMGRREWLTEAGWQQAYDDGIRTVIDLRNPDEIRRRDTDPRVGAGALAVFDVVHAPTEDPGNAEFRALCVPYLNDPASYADNARIFPGKLAGVFSAVAAARGGVVIHCSAGRDRSGMIAAMLQDLAGAGEDAIARGYERAMRGINEHHRVSGVPHPHERYLPEDVLVPMLELRLESLRRFIRHVGTREFLRHNGITDRELAAILAKVGR